MVECYLWLLAPSLRTLLGSVSFCMSVTIIFNFPALLLPYMSVIIVILSATSTMAAACLILHPFILSRLSMFLMLLSSFAIFMMVMGIFEPYKAISDSIPRTASRSCPIEHLTIHNFWSLVDGAPVMACQCTFS